MSQEDGTTLYSEADRADMQYEAENISALEQIRSVFTLRRTVIAVSAGALIVAGTKGAIYEYESHHPVANYAEALPASQVPNILSPKHKVVPSAALSPTSAKLSEHAKPTPEVSKIPELKPQPPTRIIIPKLHIDAQVDPVDSQPTGQKNKWGGDIYSEVDFPVDADARYWVPQGEPNTLTNVDTTKDPQAALRTIIYGHASDIGNHLLFQDLQTLDIGDEFTLIAGEYAFTYKVYSVSNPSKDGLADDSQVYGIPENGRKEAALVACLPDSSSHSVRIGYLTAVHRVNQPR